MAKIKLRKKRLSVCFREQQKFKLRPIVLPKVDLMTGFIELRETIPQIIRGLKLVSSLDTNTFIK